MSVALILISDGRPCEEEAIDSACHALPMDDFAQVIHVHDSEHRLGFAGAIQQAWDQVHTEWVVHVECDFLFRERVPVERMIGLLHRQPHLAQLVLKRQPWNEQEQQAGGIVEQHPDDYQERSDQFGTVWTEHRRFWSTNPSVYSSRWCRLGWPQDRHSEGLFTHRLLADPLLRFAFWGAKHAPPLVEHIGQRAGVGY